MRGPEENGERLRPTRVTTVDADNHAGNFALQDNGVGALASPRLTAQLQGVRAMTCSCSLAGAWWLQPVSVQHIAWHLARLLLVGSFWCKWLPKVAAP